MGKAPDGPAASEQGSQQGSSNKSVFDEQFLPLAEPVRRRSKAHLAFVALQPCLVCKNSPERRTPPEDGPASFLGTKTERRIYCAALSQTPSSIGMATRRTGGQYAIGARSDCQGALGCEPCPRGARPSAFPTLHKTLHRGDHRGRVNPLAEQMLLLAHAPEQVLGRQFQ